MARIQQSRNTVLKSWVVSWKDEGSSRSKAIDDHGDAVKFKTLVEEAGDTMPAIAVLAENDLIKYAAWVHPGFLLQLRELLKAAKDDKEAVAYLRFALDLVLDIPR